VRLAQLDRGHDVAGHDRLALHPLLAHQVVEGARLLGAVAGGVHEFPADLELAREDAQQREVAEVLLGQGLEDHHRQRLALLGLAGRLGAVQLPHGRLHVER
jgi:hypothetical protein